MVTQAFSLAEIPGISLEVLVHSASFPQINIFFTIFIALTTPSGFGYHFITVILTLSFSSGICTNAVANFLNPNLVYNPRPAGVAYKPICSLCL